MISPLLTDLYQLTMAYGYWKLNLHEREAVFHQIFRKQPFKSHYSIACGLAIAAEFLENWHFAEDDLNYLATLKAPDNGDLFTHDFLEYLKNLRLSVDIDAIPEGTVVFPHEPLLRIKGPLIQGQLLESTLLNIINFQTLIATKAARVCQAAAGDPVLEFGLRRAQGPDGALSASRAAYIGGCAATSNVLAGKKYGIPVSGTHAHSWVTAFPDEMQAFSAYAKVMPHNCILLVDTYDTLAGVRHAIEAGKKLRENGGELRGIRLDSGDMAMLSQKARQMLDAAGFTQTKIIASNSLDEYIIKKIKENDGVITVWGVGTHLTTAYDHPALDGVYKLSALKDEKDQWIYKLKLSEQIVKISNPGIHQVRRFMREDQKIVDVIYDLKLGISDTPDCFPLDGAHAAIKLTDFDSSTDLLKPVFRRGKLIAQLPSIHDIRATAKNQIEQFLQTSEPIIGLENNLYHLKQKMIADVSKKNNE
ncbi:MAG TPA: nicotinate phosphoribosyltransferase [Gammaproteobacteria bacterium]|nr:nicotinate phosphoribosyltransferase [Gammaproteobacteria bacterium]